MSKLLTPPKSITQQFRNLKPGQSLKMLATHYQAPHSFARTAGIKIETEVVPRRSNNDGKILLKVTRLADDAKKITKAK